MTPATTRAGRSRPASCRARTARRSSRRGTPGLLPCRPWSGRTPARRSRTTSSSATGRCCGPRRSSTFPPTGQMYGTLADAGPPRFWDLAVLGTAGTLTPTHSRLTVASRRRSAASRRARGQRERLLERRAPGGRGGVRRPVPARRPDRLDDREPVPVHGGARVRRGRQLHRRALRAAHRVGGRLPLDRVVLRGRRSGPAFPAPAVSSYVSIRERVESHRAVARDGHG